MAKHFLPYSLDQQLLLPPNIRDWLPGNHLALFILDVVDALDLEEILSVYRAKSVRGRAGYHPKMMVSLHSSRILYGQTFIAPDRTSHL